ncbi:MAG: DUF1150 family protein [Parvularculaceae bacterium]
MQNEPETEANETTYMAHNESRLVYVRPVIAKDVMDDLTEGDDGLDMDIPEEAILYALHSADGARIALMGDRELAFAAARQHEMTPVSVH